jgi:hypothetical protein
VKRITIRIITLILISNIFFSSVLFAFNAHGAYTVIDPNYGEAPVIDGYINETNNEWDDSLKINLKLYKNESQEGAGLPIKFWIMQADVDLYFCFQFDLEPQFRDPEEFMGVLISKRVTDENVNFSEFGFDDAKIIQFSNITNGEYEYEDHYIMNDIYTKDITSDGFGAAKLTDKTVVYEFKMQVNSTEEEYDEIFLDYGEDYGFKIVYGEGTLYPDDIKKFNVVLVDINYPPPTPPPEIWEVVRFVLSIIIFSAIGGLLGLYTYKIILLRKKIERYR